MGDLLQWQGIPASPQAQAELAEVRADTLRLVLYVATGGYLLWHLATTVLWPVQRSAEAYTTALVAVPVFAGTYLLVPRSPLWATNFFVVGQFAAISWEIYVSKTADAAFLFGILALVAAFVLRPVVGLAIVGTAAGTLILLSALGSSVSRTAVWQTTIFGMIAVVGVWAASRHLSIALEWYAESHDRAEARTREAEEQRAQLVQALKQLDVAYYRLGRANAALATAWQSTEEAERAKSELVVNISHELRTPLNLIVGFSELLVTDAESYGGEALPAIYRGDANAIFRSAQHLLALVDDILDLAQAGVRKLPLKIGPTDLIGIVHEAADLVHDYIATKGVVLKTDLPSGRVVVPCDALRIRQVLLNLMTNAARFTDSGSISVELTTRKANVVLSVTDTGNGMPPDVLRHIFEEYYHVDEDSLEPSTWHAGSGLGLPISKMLVELHGGQMQAESTLGKGTKFWLTLPLDADQPDSASRTRRAKPIVHGFAVDPVLVLVGRDTIIERLLRRHLNGYRLETANDLAEAIRLAVDLRAYAIVADARQQLGELTSPVPVIQLPFSHPEQVIEAKPIVDYLVKPVSRAALLAAMNRFDQSVRRVLVVDDDARTCRLLTRMLQSAKQNYTVLVANNGAEALRSMRCNRPDLVLLDWVMPRLEGWQVLQAMADDVQLAAIRVIVISARDPSEGEQVIKGTVTVRKCEGYRPAEMLGVLEALLKSLDPPRAYLTAKGLARGEGSGD